APCLIPVVATQVAGRVPASTSTPPARIVSPARGPVSNRVAYPRRFTPMVLPWAVPPVPAANAEPRGAVVYWNVVPLGMADTTKAPLYPATFTPTTVTPPPTVRPTGFAALVTVTVDGNGAAPVHPAQVSLVEVIALAAGEARLQV